MIFIKNFVIRPLTIRLIVAVPIVTSEDGKHCGQCPWGDDCGSYCYLEGLNGGGKNFRNEVIRGFSRSPACKAAERRMKKMTETATKEGYEKGYDQGHEDQMKLRVRDAMEQRNGRKTK